MTSPLNNWLTKEEKNTPVPKKARLALRTQLFGASKSWWFLIPVFSATIFATMAFLLLATPRTKNILTPQEVLAKALDPAVTSGGIERVTQHISLSENVHDIPTDYVLYTDGTRFFSPDTPDQWIERNGDGLTLTQYIKASYGIARWIMGDQTYFDEARTDIDGWQMPSGIWACGEPTCEPGKYASELHGDVTMIEETLADGTRAYKIISQGAPPEVHSIYSNTATRFVTRTDIIRASDYHFLSHAWEADMADGRHLAGKISYTYETITETEIGHPFTLSWWLNSVDPNKKATVYCAAYSNATCADAAQNTEQHAALYLPDALIDPAALDGRSQILTNAP